MKRFFALACVCGLFSAVGCNTPQSVGPDQFKQAVEWTTSYPELVEPLNKCIEDDKFDEEEFKDFSGRYHRLVNNEHMGKVRDKLAVIKAEATKNEYKELLAKTREAAKAQGLVVKETPDGILVVEQESDSVPAAEQVDKVVSSLDSKIDKALEEALKPQVVEFEDE